MKKDDPKQPTKPVAPSMFDLDLLAAGGAVVALLGFAAKSLFVWIVGG